MLYLNSHMEHEIYNGILSDIDLAGENYWCRNQFLFHVNQIPSDYRYSGDKHKS